MKVYVDEDVFKRCKETRAKFQYSYLTDEEVVKMEHEHSIGINPKIEVLSLADYTKQVRKEVVQEIRNYIKDRIKNEMCFITRDETGEPIKTMATICSNYTINELSYMIEYLDQIEGETK